MTARGQDGDVWKMTQVSSANYEARALGIGAMMCIGEAKRLCPSLVVMPYQYEKYQAVSEQVELRGFVCRGQIYWAGLRACYRKLQSRA